MWALSFLPPTSHNAHHTFAVGARTSATQGAPHAMRVLQSNLELLYIALNHFQPLV